MYSYQRYIMFKHQPAASRLNRGRVFCNVWSLSKITYRLTWKIEKLVPWGHLLVYLHPRASAENFPGGGGQRKKRPKNSKKGRKIALLSLYLLYVHHVWKSTPLPTLMLAYTFPGYVHRTCQGATIRIQLRMLNMEMTASIRTRGATNKPAWWWWFPNPSGDGGAK